MKRLFAAFWLVLLVFFPRVVDAHDFNPGVLSLLEISPGRFSIAWTEPVDSSNAPAGVRVVFPESCRAETGILDCGRAGLAGSMRFEGMHEERMQVVVIIQYIDGGIREAIITGRKPSLELERRLSNAALGWIETGARHIAGGVDHLAFLFGLLLIVGRVRTLLATITAFTLAHSLTLVLATLGWLRLPALPVEAAIAASVVLVASEAMHSAPTATRRAPWAVALIFGLVHGLGFAGALREIGLPRKAFGWALLWFNVGIELAQLALVAGVLAIGLLVSKRFTRLDPIKRAGCYAIGALGAWLLIERVVMMFTARS